MENNEKEQIREALERFVAVKGSQNKAGNALNGISPATVSQIINPKYFYVTALLGPDKRRDVAQLGVAAQFKEQNMEHRGDKELQGPDGHLR